MVKFKWSSVDFLQLIRTSENKMNLLNWAGNIQPDNKAEISRKSLTFNMTFCVTSWVRAAYLI